jgi:hypothetical protein
MWGVLCEFCGQLPAARLYPCRPFRVDTPSTLPPNCVPVLTEDTVFDRIMEDVQGWMACSSCGALIDETAIEALAVRAHTLRSGREDAEDPSEGIDYYRFLFLQFF